MDLMNRSESAFENLLEDFQHPNPNINEKAALLLVDRWQEEFLPILISNLDSPDILIRRRAIRSLGLFGAKILPTIVEIFDSSKSQIIKVSCLKVFVKLILSWDKTPFPAEGMRVVETALEEENPELILTAIPILRLLGDQGFDLLKKFSKDKNVLKALASVTAISEIGNPLAIEHLKTLIESKDTDSLVREGCIQAINGV